MVLIDADAVKAQLGGVLKLIHVFVVELIALFRVEQFARNIDPHRSMLLRKVHRQKPIGHQVERHEFHRTGSPGLRLSVS